MRTGSSCLLVALGLCLSTTPTKPDELTPSLSESEEILAALEAAPAHLRDGAGVYVLEKFGYRHARESVNGFNCLVEREIAAAFAPKCFDSEGSATLLPVILFRTEQRKRGVQRAHTEREVAARYARQAFLAPRRIGICYMLSTRNLVVIDRAMGKVWRVGPRLMFYAPNLRSADVGATPDLAARFTIADEATQSAMIIVPVASERRTRTYYFSPDDLSPLASAPRDTNRIRSAALANSFGARF